MAHPHHDLPPGAIKLGAEESGLTARIAAERELVNDCETVLVTSTRERDNLLRYYEASPEKVRSVPCGVNLDLFRPMSTRIARRRIGAAMDEALLLYVGRFAPEKGLERLIHAIGGLKHIPRLRLIVVGGDGNGHPKSMEMIEWCRSLQVADRVDFGWIKELPSYCAADAGAAVRPRLRHGGTGGHGLPWRPGWRPWRNHSARVKLGGFKSTSLADAVAA
jgi:glycosyltransferase involved in cell wall biosynthesis